MNSEGLKGETHMQTLLQTQLDLSELASRMFTELFAYALGLTEPAFPLVFGEYGPALSLAYILALILAASLFGAVGNQLRSSPGLHKTARGISASAEADLTARANTSIGIAEVALAALAALASVLRYAALSYLALSAMLFVARLLVGVG